MEAVTGGWPPFGLRGEAVPMSTYQVLSLMIAFGILIISILNFRTKK
jgi:hypothetical protein